MTVEVHGELPTASGQSPQFFDTLLTIDFTITAGSGSSTVANITNPFVINGSTLSISSGSGNNLLAIDFSTPTAFAVNYNGYAGSFSTTGSSPITDVVYDGGSGENIVDVTTVSGADTADVGPGTLSLTGPTYQITANGVQSIGLLGSNGDTAVISGGTDDSNNLVATPTAVIMASKPTSGSSQLDYNAVDGYSTVVAQSANGADNAWLYGAATGNNTFYGSQPYSYFVGTGYNIQAVGFPEVNAFSASSGDIASLYSPAGEQSTLLAGSNQYATLSASNYTISVNNFATVYATSQGNDAARLTGSSTEANEFIASAPYTSLSGTGYTLLTYNFANVAAESSPSGDDTAYFYGVSDHNAFTGGQDESEMIGTDASGNTTYDYQANYFKSVLASTLSAGDTAGITGEAAGDQFIAGPITGYPVSAALIGAADTFSIQVFAFSQITATSAGDGGDYADLNDPPGTNTFTGQGSTAKLATPLSTYTAIGFANVVANSDDQGTDDEDVSGVDYALTIDRRLGQHLSLVASVIPAIRRRGTAL